MIRSKKNSPVMKGTVALVHSGSEFFTTAHDLIDKAAFELHLHTYILDDDATGIKIIRAMCRAAARGVKVFILVDGFASADLSAASISFLHEAGVHFRFFEPLARSNHYFLGRRLHRKVLVADGTLALVGGINISDRYNDTALGPAWKDYAVCLQGPSAKILQDLCRRSWANKHRFMAYTPPAAEFPVFLQPIFSNELVRIRQNDWLLKKRDISASYATLLSSAEQHVTIMCSYFLPGFFIRNRLERAARRGVKIRLILTQRSDVPIFKYAERYLYGWLLHRGIEIYEYEKSVVHAKVGVADGRWATVGSYNINDLSAFASIELNVDVVSPDFAAQLESELNQNIQNDSKAITLENYSKKRRFYSTFINWSAYQLMRLSFALAGFQIKV
ncbi:MAG: phospholipase [Lewinellaceae bacterium]|nr:phospholipase [Lewinellaceae bacterium]